MAVYPSRNRRRSAGEGSVYKTADGRWRGAVTWTEADGKRHRRYVTGATAAEARAKLDVQREKLRIGILEPAGAGTVGQYLQTWIERYRSRVRPATWRSAEIHVRCYLVPALGRFQLTKLGAEDVERALAWFQEHGRAATTSTRGVQKVRPVSPMTVRHVRATLRRALADAVRARAVGRNVAADASPPYVPHRPVAYLSRSEIRVLLDGTREDPDGPLYALAVSTGLRLGELMGLAWADIDLPAGTLTVRRSMARQAYGNVWKLGDTKTGRSRRTLPLPATARDALDRELARQAEARLVAGDAWQNTDGLVFTDAIGRPRSPAHVSKRFQDRRLALRLPAIRFHDLRHSAATLMLAEGIALAVISEWLGHSGIAITAMHYAAIVPELRDDARSAMDRALGGVS